MSKIIYPRIREKQAVSRSGFRLQESALTRMRDLGPRMTSILAPLMTHTS